MLQRTYHHHHCHHRNTKHLRYLPLLHGNQTPHNRLSSLFHSTQAIQCWFGHGYVHVQYQLPQQALGSPKCLAVLSREHIAQTSS